MGWDGKVIAWALQRFQEDRRQREERLEERREKIFARQPACGRLTGSCGQP